MEALFKFIDRLLYGKPRERTEILNKKNINPKFLAIEQYTAPGNPTIATVLKKVDDFTFLTDRGTYRTGTTFGDSWVPDYLVAYGDTAEEASKNVEEYYDRWFDWFLKIGQEMVPFLHAQLVAQKQAQTK